MGRYRLKRKFIMGNSISRHSTAIEDSLKAFSRGVLPALQAGGRGSDSQEMAGAMDVETRGAMEVGERDGGFRCELIQQGVKAWKGAGEGVL